MTATRVVELPITVGESTRCKHAEDPNRIGYGLCGVRLSGSPSAPSGDRCIVCRNLLRRDFVTR